MPRTSSVNHKQNFLTVRASCRLRAIVCNAGSNHGGHARAFREKRFVACSFVGAFLVTYPIKLEPTRAVKAWLPSITWRGSVSVQNECHWCLLCPGRTSVWPPPWYGILHKCRMIEYTIFVVFRKQPARTHRYRMPRLKQPQHRLPQPVIILYMQISARQPQPQSPGAAQQPCQESPYPL